MKSEKETSKYLSLILRHKPEVIGITLDEHGWADVDELISGGGYSAGYLPVRGISTRFRIKRPCHGY